MPKLLPADEAFLSSAPVRFHETFSIARPAEAVWAEMVVDKPLAFCRVLDITWTSPRPLGVGTTRQAKILGGAIKLQEEYFLWEEGHRKAFRGTEASLPLFKRIAEDYVVEPDGPDRCTLAWTIAMEPTLLGRGPANPLLVKSIFADTRKHFGAG